MGIDRDSECENARARCGAAYFGYEPVEPAGPRVEWQIVGIPGEPGAHLPADFPTWLPFGTYRFFAHAEPAPSQTPMESPQVTTLNWCDAVMEINEQWEVADGGIHFWNNGYCSIHLGLSSWQERPVPTPKPVPTPVLDPDASIPLQHRQLTRVRLPSGYGDSVGAWAAVGARAVWTGSGGDILLADLAAGGFGPIGTYDGWDPERIAFDGERVFWLEAANEVIPDQVPYLSRGALNWRLRMLDVETALSRVIRSGTEHRYVYCGPMSPVFAVDDDGNVAIASESAAGGWEISIGPIDGPATETIHSDTPIESVALSSGVVAYVTGSVIGNHLESDEIATFVDTRLLVASGSAADTNEVAEDAYQVKLEDGRLVWMRGLPWYLAGRPGELLTATLEDETPLKISDIDYPTFDLGDGYVTWGPAVNLWSSWNGNTASIDPVWGPTQMSYGTVSNGWLTWYGDRDGEIYGPNFMFGIEVEDLRL